MTKHIYYLSVNIINNQFYLNDKVANMTKHIKLY